MLVNGDWDTELNVDRAIISVDCYEELTETKYHGLHK